MFTVTTYYAFIPLSEAKLEDYQKMLTEKGEEMDLRGLFLIGTEGLNATISGTESSIADYKDFLQQEFGPITFKDSPSPEQPFRRWHVKIRDEIVALGDTSIIPEREEDDSHLTPEEWNRVMDNEDVVVLDTRNTYETDIGVFEGAVDPRLSVFSEFREYVENCDIPKDKKVLMYCTGGIRCEKASLEMRRQGYEHVYQLKGGILQYLKECPNQKFQGECFIFDHRTAVDQDLNPSTRYASCPFCGDPGDVTINCVHCQTESIVCRGCRAKKNVDVCSKDCDYQYHREQKKTCEV